MIMIWISLHVKFLNCKNIIVKFCQRNLNQRIIKNIVKISHHRKQRIFHRNFINFSCVKLICFNQWQNFCKLPVNVSLWSWGFYFNIQGWKSNSFWICLSFIIYQNLPNFILNLNQSWRVCNLVRLYPKFSIFKRKNMLKNQIFFLLFFLNFWNQLLASWLKLKFNVFRVYSLRWNFKKIIIFARFLSRISFENYVESFKNSTNVQGSSHPQIPSQDPVP